MATKTKLVPKTKIVNGKRVPITPPQTPKNAALEKRRDELQAQLNTLQGKKVAPVAQTSQSPFDSMIKNNALLSDKLKKDQQLSQWFYAQDPNTQGMFVQMYGQLEKSIEAGKVVNPNIEITPKKLKEFMKTASSQLDPYYKEQYNTLKTDIDTSISRLQEDYDKGIQRARDPFAQSLKDQAQQESEQGTVYSSGRNQREATAVTNQNQKLEDFTTDATRSVQDILGGYEQIVGSNTARNINLPSIQGYQADNTGAFNSTGSRSLSVPYGGIELGSLGREQATAKKTRAQQLEEIYRAGQVLNRQQY